MPITRSNTATLPTVSLRRNAGEFIPSVYVLNAAALTKPYAVQHQAADLQKNNIDVAFTTETQFKAKHSDGVIAVRAVTRAYVYCRDRVGRKGGGVAIYVLSGPHCSQYAADNSAQITLTFPKKLTVLATDFNQLSIEQRTGLISLVSHPTRGAIILDPILV